MDSQKFVDLAGAAFPGVDSPACFYRNDRENLEYGGMKMIKEYQKMLCDLPYRSLEAAEKALKSRYDVDISTLKSADYNKLIHNVQYSISNIFLTLSESASCEEVLKELGGKKYRTEAFERYLRHESFMPIFMRL